MKKPAAVFVHGLFLNGAEFTLLRRRTRGGARLRVPSLQLSHGARLDGSDVSSSSRASSSASTPSASISSGTAWAASCCAAISRTRGGLPRGPRRVARLARWSRAARRERVARHACAHARHRSAGRGGARGQLRAAPLGLRARARLHRRHAPDGPRALLRALRRGLRRHRRRERNQTTGPHRAPDAAGEPHGHAVSADWSRGRSVRFLEQALRRFD